MTYSHPVTTPAATRKLRDRERREALILDVARDMLLERGYLGLTMDRVADATEFSKGTVYQHFSSKEDLMAAVAAQSLKVRVALFERAATCRGRSRERFTAVGAAAEIFFQLYPHYGQAEQVLLASSISSKLSPERATSMHACHFTCHAVVSGVVRDAVAQGDLVLPHGITPDEVTFNMRSLYSGTFSILQSETDLSHLGVPNPLLSMRRHAHVLLDGLGWKPLSTEWDYPATHERILAEVFPEEARKIDDLS